MGILPNPPTFADISMEGVGTGFVLSKPLCESGHQESILVEEEMSQSFRSMMEGPFLPFHRILFHLFLPFLFFFCLHLHPHECLHPLLIGSISVPTETQNTYLRPQLDKEA